MEDSLEGLKFIPQGKNNVLGLVTTKTPELEDLDVLVGRFDEAAEVIAQGQGRTAGEVLADTLGVSPQCCFSSHSTMRGAGSEEHVEEATLSPGSNSESLERDKTRGKITPQDCYIFVFCVLRGHWTSGVRNGIRIIIYL